MGGKFSKNNTYLVSPVQGKTWEATNNSDGENDDHDDDLEDEPVNYNRGHRKSVFAEAYNPEEDDSAADEKIIHPKTDAQRVQLSEAVKPVLLFRNLDSNQLTDVLDAIFEKNVEENEVVIQQGEDGDNFYVVGSGVYNIILDSPTGPKTVGKYDNKGSFGELALLYNMPRAATIQAVTSGQLWCMDRTTFRRIILRSAYQKRKMYESLLATVPLLTHLDDNERTNLADALASQEYNNGDKIIKQGDPGDGMYFLESGTADVVVKNNGEEKMVKEYHKGDYFGELALITHNPRAATISAKDSVRVAFLDVLAFERLLGPCREIMKDRIPDYKEQLINLFGSTVNESD